MKLQLIFPKTVDGKDPHGEFDFPERRLFITEVQRSPVFCESAGQGSDGCRRFVSLWL